MCANLQRWFPALCSRVTLLKLKTFRRCLPVGVLCTHYAHGPLALEVSPQLPVGTRSRQGQKDFGGGRIHHSKAKEAWDK